MLWLAQKNKAVTVAVAVAVAKLVVLNVTYNVWRKNIGFTEERRMQLDRTEIQNVDVYAWYFVRKQTTFGVLAISEYSDLLQNIFSYRKSSSVEYVFLQKDLVKLSKTSSKRTTNKERDGEILWKEM